MQVILYDRDEVIAFNNTRSLLPVQTSSNVRTEYFNIPLTSVSKMILRFIGCSEPGGIIPHYICGTDSRHNHQAPLVHV